MTDLLWQLLKLSYKRQGIHFSMETVATNCILNFVKKKKGAEYNLQWHLDYCILK